MDKCSVTLTLRQIHVLREALGSLSLDMCRISPYWSDELSAARDHMEQEISELQSVLKKAEQNTN